MINMTRNKTRWYEHWLSAPTPLLWLSYLEHGLLTPALDCIGTRREYTNVYKREGEEEKIRYQVLIAAQSFRPITLLSPVTLRYLLGSRNRSVHLGVLALGCWLDRPTASMPLVNEFLKTHHVSWDEIYRGMKLARSLGLVRSQRSRPDIGRHYRQLYARKA